MLSAVTAAGSGLCWLGSVHSSVAASGEEIQSAWPAPSLAKPEGTCHPSAMLEKTLFFQNLTGLVLQSVGIPEATLSAVNHNLTHIKIIPFPQ